MSTRIDLVLRQDPYLRITLCAGGNCEEHLEIANGQQGLDVGLEDAVEIRGAIDELERFVESRRGGGKV